MASILLVDCASHVLRLAIEQEGRLYQHVYGDSPVHGSVILDMLDRVCRQAHCSPDQFDYVCWNRGPGSFTGIRLALSLVQALTLGHDTAVVSLSSLGALAVQAFRTFGYQQVVCLVDARMNQVYKAVVRIDDRSLVYEQPESIISLTQLASLTTDYPWVGSDLSGFMDYTSESVHQARDLVVETESLFELAHRQIGSGDVRCIDQVRASYLYDYS